MSIHNPLPIGKLLRYTERKYNGGKPRSRMKKVLLLFALIGAAAAEAKDIRCVCNDRTVQRPECGICGTEAGRMDLTDDGVDCMCSNNLKLKSISCPVVCENNGGWSGDFLVR